MNNLFNPDSKFVLFMGRVADFMILNLLCILCCLPIVTAGASVTALYYVTMKMVRNEETYVARNFFHSFRENLRQGIIIHLILLLVGALLGFNLYSSRKLQGDYSIYSTLFYIFIAILIVYVLILTYIYPVLARFYCSVKNTFLNALMMSIRHFPYTVLIILITVLPVLLMLWTAHTFAVLSLFFIFMGFAVIAFLHSFLFVKIFDKYSPQVQEESPDEE